MNEQHLSRRIEWISKMLPVCLRIFPVCFVSFFGFLVLFSLVFHRVSMGDLLHTGCAVIFKMQQEHGLELWNSLSGLCFYGDKMGRLTLR